MTTQTETQHFILTVQLSNGTVSTRAGIWTPETPADARRDVALSRIVDATFPGVMPNIVVLFFSLEPNQL